jgi:threonine dehydrogenase-like Zn-dependent dehydrogenase
MNRVRFAGRRKVVVEECVLPGEVPDGEVLVRVAACGICGTDLRQFEGRWKQSSFTPGHEIAGSVERTGPSVKGLERGARVTVVPLVACGDCRYCVEGRSNLCESGDVMTELRDGGMASHVLVPAYALRTIPDTIPDEQGSLLEPLSVALHCVRMCENAMGLTVAVVGAGTIGLLCLQVAKAMGAARAICVAKHPFQGDLARSLGADVVADASSASDDLAGTADLAVDCAGGKGNGLAGAMKLVRRGGTIIAVGGYEGLAGVDMWRAARNENRILGAFCYSKTDGVVHDMDMAIHMAADQRVQLGLLVSHRFTLSEAQAAFETASDKAASKAVKVMLTCGGAA